MNNNVLKKKKTPLPLGFSLWRTTNQKRSFDKFNSRKVAQPHLEKQLIWQAPVKRGKINK